jgi:hypothetical protein
MRRWDGIAGKFLYVNSDGLYKDETDGSIYYKDSGGDFCIWCAAGRLRQHLQHLYQITRRSAHDEKTKKHIVNII